MGRGIRLLFLLGLRRTLRLRSIRVVRFCCIIYYILFAGRLLRHRCRCSLRRCRHRIVLPLRYSAEQGSNFIDAIPLYHHKHTHLLHHGRRVVILPILLCIVGAGHAADQYAAHAVDECDPRKQYQTEPLNALPRMRLPDFLLSQNFQHNDRQRKKHQQRCHLQHAQQGFPPIVRQSVLSAEKHCRKLERLPENVHIDSLQGENGELQPEHDTGCYFLPLLRKTVSQ